MSVNIPTHYVQQYTTNIQLLLQQRGSRLKNAVMVGNHVGKQAVPVDQIGKVEMQTPAGRFADIGRVDAAMDRRWVFPTDKDLPQLIDSFDKLRLLTDPTSQYVTNAVQAAGREHDRRIIDAFFDDAKTGETGSTTTSFGTALTSASGRNVAVALGAAAAVGLTVAKLREAKRYLMSKNVDLETDPLFCVVTAKQHDDLLSEIQVTSMDFNTTNGQPVMQEGRISRFLGINFIHTELLETGTDNASGTSRAVPVFAKSGMYLGVWNEMTVDVDQRKDLSGLPYQVYLAMTSGATRLEEDKVCRVWCRE